MIGVDAPPADRDEDWLHRRLHKLGGKRVHRLGLASNYGLDEAGVRTAFERGLNYVFAGYTNKSAHGPLAEACARDRAGMVIATGPTVGYLGGSVRRAAERALRRYQTDYLDVFHLFWVGVGSAWTDATVRELRTLKEEGKVRATAVSIHDRPRAGRLAAEGAVDLLMIRYNAAHPGAEQDIFPHLAPRGDPRRPVVLAYTATRWKKLLRAPKGWSGPVMRAADCYRFCLSHPDVDLVLGGPGSVAELDENLAGLAEGPLSAAEDAWMRDYGRAVRATAGASPF
jgi:aryl-alcohol dehydrogenase-like predicted oxidoreductase